MGTDIHMLAERRIKGKWEMVKDRVFPNPYYDDGTDEDDNNNTRYTNVPYSNRNYDLFAILADVRNGAWGDHFNPISAPKGYPLDLDPDAQKDLDCIADYTDDLPHLSVQHSASYLTLKELLDYDWLSQSHSSFGYVTEEDYKYCIKRGLLPPSWCGGVSGYGIERVSASEMEAILLDPSLRNPSVRYYVGCHFPAESYADAAGSFYTSTIPILKSLIPEGGTPEDVRIVFDFDS